MPRTATGIDIGHRTAKLIRGQYKGNTFHVSRFDIVSHEAGDVAGGWKSLQLDWKPTQARIGLTGREVNIRYTRVPQVPDWQLKKLMRFEVAEIGEQSGSGVASDFNLLPPLPEIDGEDVVLLAMAREDLLEKHLEGIAKLGGQVDSFAPNALALYNAFLRYGVLGDDTVLLANVGHDNLDVVICRGPDLVFARNLTGGSRLFDQAIAERFGVSERKANEVKHELATLLPGATFRDANQEKASRAILGAAGQLLSLLQSTVLFCKSQLKIPGLKIERVLLTGGGAALEGLPEYLTQGMGVKVEIFDPFTVVDTKALDAESAALLEDHRLECVVALGLATMGSDSEAYSIEILPEAMRARREFLGGPAFLIAAAVLAVAYLGWDVYSQRGQLAVLQQDEAIASTQLGRAKRVHEETRELLERNAALDAHATDLWALLGSGEQIARSFETLTRDMPAEFWITKYQSAWRTDPELGVVSGSERPIVRVEGRAREGTASMAVLYERFLERTRDSLSDAALKAAPSPKGTEFSLDFTLFAPREDAPATNETL